MQPGKSTGRALKKSDSEDSKDEHRSSEAEPAPKETEVEIKLTTFSPEILSKIRYNFRDGIYEKVPTKCYFEEIFSQESKVCLKEDNKLSKEKNLEEDVSEHSDGDEDGKDDDLYGGAITKAELKKLDAQPNPFNFSERVTQTVRITTQEAAVQTEPPPSTTFCMNASQSAIYDAYFVDNEKKREREKEKEKEKQKEKKERKAKKDKLPQQEDSEDNEGDTNKTEKAPLMDFALLTSEPIAPPGKGLDIRGEDRIDSKALAATALIMERMVSQNTYDEIAQDFKFWEDGSDEYRPMEGSLLPLWKFHYEKSRTLIVSCTKWSPIYPDLLLATYTTGKGEIGGPHSEGMLCLYSLKNPSSPERILRTPCGVTCADFHPSISSVLAAGWADGSVVIYDIKSVMDPTIIMSSVIGGKHLLAVLQVTWLSVHPGDDLKFCSVSLDGRISVWLLQSSQLTHSDLFDFNEAPKSCHNEKVTLEGIGTYVAFHPENRDNLLVGTDSGVIFQASATAVMHNLVRYPGHTGSVRTVSWNYHNNKVFLSCSIDWCLKVWLEHHLAPLVMLDLGAPVADVCWAPYSSSVIVGVTDEGNVHVYDLFQRKCRPLCVQNIVKKRKVSLTSMAFSLFYPVIVVGGDRGHLVTLKLSPNLRKHYRDSKSVDEQRSQEIELAKMERLIAISCR